MSETLDKLMDIVQKLVDDVLEGDPPRWQGDKLAAELKPIIEDAERYRKIKRMHEEFSSIVIEYPWLKIGVKNGRVEQSLFISAKGLDQAVDEVGE